jgi:hypothetical protein
MAQQASKKSSILSRGYKRLIHCEADRSANVCGGFPREHGVPHVASRALVVSHGFIGNMKHFEKEPEIFNVVRVLVIVNRKPKDCV